MCRHAAFYEQIGADLEVVKWVRNGYEMKLKRWPQDSVTKYSRYLETGTWERNVTFNVSRLAKKSCSSGQTRRRCD